MKFSTLTMETIQWFVFMLAGIVALPIVIGTIFEMNFAEIAGLMQRSFFVVGVASLLQVLFGHKLAILEGPAGVWISVFAIMAVTGTQANTSLTETLRELEAILIVTGIFLILFGVFKLSKRILPIFTPLVTGTFFLLLTAQLSGTFLEGMLGLNSGSGTIQVTEALIAFFTLFLIFGLSLFAKDWLSNYAVLIGIIIGWILYRLFIGDTTSETEVEMISLPEVFAFGSPSFDLSVIPIAFVTAIIIVSNLVAAIVSMNQTLGIKAENKHNQVNRSMSFSGVNHILAGIFSAIGNVPLASSSGFVALTNQKRKIPFIFASIVLILISFFPSIISFISSIPSPIANAALTATFVQLVGLAIRNLAADMNKKNTAIMGIAILIGWGIMFLPPEAFQNLPSMLQNVMSNGLLVGTILAILMEQIWKKRKNER